MWIGVNKKLFLWGINMKNSKKIENKTPKDDFRRSILHWSLDLTFKTKEQMIEFINELMFLEIAYDFSYNSSPSENIYNLTIHNMCWAGNLQTVAEILEKIDCQSP